MPYGTSAACRCQPENDTRSRSCAYSHRTTVQTAVVQEQLRCSNENVTEKGPMQRPADLNPQRREKRRAQFARFHIGTGRNPKPPYASGVSPGGSNGFNTSSGITQASTRDASTGFDGHPMSLDQIQQPAFVKSGAHRQQPRIRQPALN
jgi:hypothetical protein